MSDFIEKLRKSCTQTFTLKELISLAKNLPEKFEGVVNLYGVMSNIRRVRSSMQADPRYGDRPLPAKVFIVDNLDWDEDPSSLSADLYVTDKRGRVKNALLDPDTDLKIELRRKKNPNLKIFSFFGGSTIMGDGAQLPQFTIPALVEQILNTEYGIDCVCINNGVLGWTIQDSFALLSNEVLKEKSDAIIFYSGWNCIRSFTITEALKRANSFGGKFRITDGCSVRHITFNYFLYNRFNPSKTFRHGFFSLANLVMSSALIYVPSKFLHKHLKKAISKYIPVQEDLSDEMTKAVEQSEIGVLSAGAVKHYQHINLMAKACSEKSGSVYFSYFQPLLYFGNKKLSPEEELFFDKYNHYPEYYQKFYELIKGHLSEDGMIDLVDLFNNVSEQLYIDIGHLNKTGYFLVAQKIAKDIAGVDSLRSGNI
jgi:hypothetical protein